MLEPGKRYVGPSGIELIVIKGGKGNLSDNQIPFVLKGSELQISSEDLDFVNALLKKKSAQQEFDF